jgi:hypothetical protein
LAYFAFFTLSALIFAHRAFADREIRARTAADIVLLRLVPFELPVRSGDTEVVLAPFKAARALVTALNCRCSFDSSCFNAPIISMKPPADIRHWVDSKVQGFGGTPNFRKCYIPLH